MNARIFSKINTGLDSLEEEKLFITYHFSKKINSYRGISNIIRDHSLILRFQKLIILNLILHSKNS